MVDVEYANAYSEVLEIIKHISKDDYDKIPKEKIELFETNANKDNHITYNPDKTLDEQNISKRAKVIIAILFRDYWATPDQQERIIAKQNYDRQKMEEENRQKYNPDDIFKNKRKQENCENIKEMSSQNLPVEYKESFYQRFINFIKKIFRLQR